MFWRFSAAWSLQLDERFEEVAQQFMKEFVGKRQRSPRWKDCESAVNSRLNYASGAMYVRRYFERADRDAALEMVQDLRQAFGVMLERNEWMRNETKQYALKKARDMQALIGFPDMVYNDTELDEYYKGVSAEVRRECTLEHVDHHQYEDPEFMTFAVDHYADHFGVDKNSKHVRNKHHVHTSTPILTPLI